MCIFSTTRYIFQRKALSKSKIPLFASRVLRRQDSGHLIPTVEIFLNELEHERYDRVNNYYLNWGTIFCCMEIIWFLKIRFPHKYLRIRKKQEKYGKKKTYICDFASGGTKSFAPLKNVNILWCASVASPNIPKFWVNGFFFKTKKKQKYEKTLRTQNTVNCEIYYIFDASQFSQSRDSKWCISFKFSRAS